jgi:hypothetical protein
MQVSQDFRGGYRVRDIRLTRNASLTLMRFGTELRRFADALYLLRRQIGRNLS